MERKKYVDIRYSELCVCILSYFVVTACLKVWYTLYSCNSQLFPKQYNDTTPYAAYYYYRIPILQYIQLQKLFERLGQSDQSKSSYWSSSQSIGNWLVSLSPVLGTLQAAFPVAAGMVGV